jgi:hypothetical protein
MRERFGEISVVISPPIGDRRWMRPIHLLIPETEREKSAAIEPVQK